VLGLRPSGTFCLSAGKERKFEKMSALQNSVGCKSRCDQDGRGDRGMFSSRELTVNLGCRLLLLFHARRLLRLSAEATS
jgi:hypothetical protein